MGYLWWFGGAGIDEMGGEGGDEGHCIFSESQRC